jgi:phosphopantothenoylcysteine decarboxylase/phosphopantothenate--cysteine ligase
MAALKRILLIVAGGIAAYKSLELIRRGRERGYAFRVILTKGGAEFVTPLSFSSLSGDKVYQELFSLTDEAEMGHIRLSRAADLVVVAPASADLLAKMAQGRADDLASTALLATDKPVLVAPAMNVMMWANPATQANIALLKSRGVHVVGPGSGDLACGEEGSGRLSEPHDILDAMDRLLQIERVLGGIKALVTSGPTHEPIDPVRYIANRSSGKQGHAIAAALARHGAETTLVAGPTQLPDPPGLRTLRVETAQEMLAACRAALPVEVAVCAAAVADWRAATAAQHKLKKDNASPAALELVQNPDILAELSQAGGRRPSLVIGFAAETEKVVEQGRAKLTRKGCDWILANDVAPGTATFGGDENRIHLITADGVDDWPQMTKAEVAERLCREIAVTLGRPQLQ